MAGNKPPTCVSTDETVEDVSIFAMENTWRILVQNWNKRKLGKIRHFPGRRRLVRTAISNRHRCIDILAARQSKKALLVIELKKGRAVIILLDKFSVTGVM